MTASVPRGTRSLGGFTVVEFMVAIAILAILASVAVPAMGEFIRTSRVRGAGMELQAALVRARSEAINRNADVEVVPHDGDWRNGWTMQVAGGDLIEDREALAGVTAAPSPAPTVRYRMNGRVAAGSQTIVISDPASPRTQPRCVTLSASGRAKSQIDHDFDPANGCN